VNNRKDYPENWTQVSIRYRKSKGGRCEKCGKIETRKKPNHTDHIDGDKQNILESNLMVVCPRCHFIKGVRTGQIIPVTFQRLEVSSFERRLKCSLHLTETPKLTGL